MTIKSIVAELEKYRERLVTAANILTDEPKFLRPKLADVVFRPSASLTKDVNIYPGPIRWSKTTVVRKRKRRFTPEQRKEISRRMKLEWKRRKAG